MTHIRALLRWAATAALAVSGLVAVVAPAAAAEPAGPTITIGTFHASFSPNGDGRHDRLRIPFTLSRWAHLSATLERPDGTVVHINCAIIRVDCVPGAGRYTITSRDLRLGARTPDAGRYRLVLLALRDGAIVDRARTTFDLRRNIELDPRDAFTVIASDDDGTDLGFDLRRPARVNVALRAVSGGPTYRVGLGALPRGHAAWTWDGRIHGARVPDGLYAVTLRATGPGASPSRAVAEVVVDAAEPDAAIRLNRSTLYVRQHSRPEGQGADSIRIGVSANPSQVEVAEIRSESGRRLTRLITHRHECWWGDDGVNRWCTLINWYGFGGGVAPGDYSLLLVVRNEDGTTAVHRQPITVSDEQLVEHTGTVTWTAANAPQAEDICNANGCGEVVPCPPVASERFVGGLSFRSDPTSCPDTIGNAASGAAYGFTPDVPSTPYDRFRLLVTGGPTTPGDDDGAFAFLSRSDSDAREGGPRVELVGDGTFATDWTTVRPDVELFAPTAGPTTADERMRWDLGTMRPNRYDIASYTLEYTYWAPAP